MNVDLFTVEELKRAQDIRSTSRDNLQFIQRVQDDILTDEVMARIDKATGQTNDRKYMAYRIEYVLGEVQ